MAEVAETSGVAIPAAATAAPPAITPTASVRTVPWVEKYRPSSLQDVVAHEEILGTLKRLMESQNMPHLLFYGPPGTGKTTTIKACSSHLFGNRVRGNVLELNASDDRGIDVVRNQIKEFSSTGSIFAGMRKAPAAAAVPPVAPSATTGEESGSAPASVVVPQPPPPTTAAATVSVNFKLVILDEADQMSHDAQAALRRVIEKYTKNVRFCIICNHINKVIPAVQSRCTRFRFSPVKKEHMVPRLLYIAQQENIRCTEEGIVAAFRLSNGDMRRCMNMMQAAALSVNEITEESVYTATGNPTPAEIKALLSMMLEKDFVVAWECVQDAVRRKGASVVDIVREMYPLIMRLSLPEAYQAFLVEKLADLEYYLSTGTSESIALGGLLGAFQLVKESASRGVPIEKLASC